TRKMERLLPARSPISGLTAGLEPVPVFPVLVFDLPKRFCTPFSPMGQGYCSRFLRWILPLKESKLTEDAAWPTVPAKALPARGTKDVCSGCNVKSFSTRPCTERATTSIEA